MPRNLLFITFDSLRWDVFMEADAPCLKALGTWKKAYTQGTYTFPAHMSFFVGKLPQTLDDSPGYDCVATRVDSDGRTRRNAPWVRIENPETRRKSAMDLKGRNLAEGFANQGYATFCTGAVNWFNPALPAGRCVTDAFEHVRFFGGPNHASHKSARLQLEWATERINTSDRPYFLFINFGETHSNFVHEGCAWEYEPIDYGDPAGCRQRQRACLEYLDKTLQPFLATIRDTDIILCSDHGEAMGEDDLWGHGFFHPTVMEVPFLMKVEWPQ